MLSQSNENSSPPHRPVPMQLQPDFRYMIYLGEDDSGLKLADVFVVLEGKSVKIGEQRFTGGQGGTEYWFYSNQNDTIQCITTEQSIYIKAVVIRL
jgi:hypothetical protein